MNTPIERATAHYKDRADSIRQVEVPEWELTIYVKPANLAVRDKLFTATQTVGLGALVDTLILRALNEDGTRIFKPVDRTALMNEVDPDVLVRVAAEINEDMAEISAEAIDEAAGN